MTHTFSIVHSGSGRYVDEPSIEAPLDVPARDVPYCIHLKSDAPQVFIEYSFSSGGEEKVWKHAENVDLCLGAKSGKVYALNIKDLRQVNASLLNAEKDLKLTVDSRYRRNIHFGVELAEKALQAVVSRP